MAIALDSSTAWADDSAYNDYVTSGSFSPGAGTVLIALVKCGGKSSPSVTNTGTALTWTLVASDESTADFVYIYRATNSAAQSGITVTFSDTGAPYNAASLAVLVFSGADTSSPVGASSNGRGSGATGANLTSGMTTTVANSRLVLIASDQDLRGTPTAGSGVTNSAGDAWYDTVWGLWSFSSSGVAMDSGVVRSSGAGSKGWQWAAFELKPAGATTHSATATSTVTASRTATAAVERAAAASSSTTASITAAAARTQMASASLTATATITAAASVVTTHTADASSTATATVTATAAVDAVGTAGLTTTATVTASATVTTGGVYAADAAASIAAAVTAAVAATRAASVSVSTSATISASATVLVGGVGTPGTMSPLDLSSATMSATEGASTTQRMTLLSFDAATMTAVLTTEATSPPVGVPVFVGPDDPVTLGLVAAGARHVWFHSGTVFVQE